MKFYQACYGKPNNNWELFNVSPDIPPSYSAIFEKYGKACTPESIGIEKTVNSDGSHLCLYELISDDRKICLIRARYGERDNFGRPKMFAHGFVLDGNELLSNPENVLAISDENFKFTEDETRTIPEYLLCDGEFSINKSLSVMAVNEDTYKKLISCVYILLSSMTDFPLYVICDNNPAVVKNAIYSILCALPFQLRYLLSFSNANSFQYSRFKRIMFVTQAPVNEKYFSLVDGSTNLNYSELKTIPEKHRIYNHLLTLNLQEYSAYFTDLDRTATKMMYPVSANYDDMNMVELIKNGIGDLAEKDGVVLTKYLLELLTKISYQSLFIDEYMADVLTIFDQKRIALNDSIINRIMQKSSATQSERLSSVGFNIKTRNLVNRNVEFMYEFLNQQRLKSNSAFNEWCNRILNFEGGLQALSSYYEYLILHTTDYDKLYQACAESNQQHVWLQENVRKAAKKQVFIIAIKKISPEYINDISFADVYAQMEKCVNSIFPSHGKSYIAEYLTGIKDHFWNNFKISDFSFSPMCASNCDFIKNEKNGRSKAVNKLNDFYKVVCSYSTGEKSFIHIGRTLDILSESLVEYPEEFLEISSRVQKYVLKVAEKDKERHFSVWLKLSSLGRNNNNPLKLMIKWELPVICNEALFIEDFSSSPYLQSICDNLLFWMLGNEKKTDIAERLDCKPEIAKVIGREARYLEDYKKQVAAQEKMREKEQRKLEKQEKQEKKKTDFSAMRVSKEDEAFFEKLEAPASNKKGLLSFFDKKKK